MIEHRWCYPASIKETLAKISKIAKPEKKMHF